MLPPRHCSMHSDVGVLFGFCLFSPQRAESIVAQRERQLVPISQRTLQNHILPTCSYALACFVFCFVLFFLFLQGGGSDMEEPFEQLGKHRSLKMMVFMIIFKVNFSLPFWEREIMPSTASRQASKKELFHLPNPQVKMQETLFCAICTFLGCFLLALVPWVCPQRSPAVSVTGPTGESQPRTRDAAIRCCTLTFSLAALVATHKFCFFSARGGMAGDDKRLFYLEIAYNNSSQRAGIFVGSQNPPKGAARRAQVTAPVTFSA